MDKVSNEIRPIRILAALLILNLLLGAVILIFPQGKIPLGGNYSLNFVPFSKLFQEDTTKVVDVMEVIADVETVDTNLLELDKKSIEKIKNEKITVEGHKQIKYGEVNKNALKSFFDALIQLENGKDHIRVIHYGDSQLEGDRISDYLRNRLQLLYGGWGPGLILPIDISRSRISVLQSESKNWVKYSIYKNKPKEPSGLYGIGASCYKYTGVVTPEKKQIITKKYLSKKSIGLDSLEHTSIDSNRFYFDTSYVNPEPETFEGAWINLKNANMGFKRVRQYETASLLYSSEKPFYVKVQVKDGPEVIEQLPSGQAMIKKWDFGEVTTGIKLSFSGESPTLHGIALDGKTGITVDNFPMRGSSGLGFSTINRNLLKKQYQQMNVKLIVLQYGINLVPGEAKNYDWYQRMYSKEIAAIKAAAPDVSILVIGPSDMSRKTAEGYESYTNIPLINEAMKKAAFENGCAFWNLYESMGGQNSMSSWVENKLAAKDYTHFSSSGARFVGEMLYNALLEEFQKYLNTKSKMPL